MNTKVKPTRAGCHWFILAFYLTFLIAGIVLELAFASTVRDSLLDSLYLVALVDTFHTFFVLEVVVTGGVDVSVSSNGCIPFKPQIIAGVICALIDLSIIVLCVSCMPGSFKASHVSFTTLLILGFFVSPYIAAFLAFPLTRVLLRPK